MNKAGKKFIDIVREICNYAQTLPPERRAHFTAFQICMMLNDTGEFGDGDREFKVVTVKGKPVEFMHHDL